MSKNQSTTNNPINEFFQNQMNAAKSMFENSANGGADAFPWMKQMSDMMTQMNNFNKMNEMMQNNPMYTAMQQMMNGSNGQWTEMMKNMQSNPMTANMMNPNAMSDMMKNFQSNPMMANMMNPNAMNDMMKNFQSNPMMANMMNPTAMNDIMKNMMSMNMNGKMTEMTENWNGQMKKNLDMMNNSYGEMMKNFQNMTSANSFADMQKTVNSLSKFSDIWEPMMASLKNNTFTTEQFQQMINPAKYQEFMDSFFSFMPAETKANMEAMQLQFIQTMKQMSQMGTNNYNVVKAGIASNPMNQANPFSTMMDMYTTLRNSFNETSNPLTKLMAGNASVEKMNAWNEISDLMITYNTKNNQLQYMMYQHGLKAMQDTAEQMMHKVQNGETVDSMVKVYQEWMAKGDQVFTHLFETDEYSALMTEVSSIQMKLKAAIEKQMEEQVFANMPLATRTEMDEVYKNIYDIKKMYRNVERMFGMDSAEVKPTATATAAPKAAKPAPTAKAAPVKKAAPTKKAAPAKKVVAKKAKK